MVHAFAALSTLRFGVAALAALALLLGACGGGSPDQHVQPPLVRAFSPFLSPMDFNTLQQNPTFTNGNLTDSTDPSYPGKIVIFFQADTILDPSSLFVGGDPSLGLDLSALQILQFIPGTGNVELPLSGVEVLSDRIICTPASLPLAGGQYSIGVFVNVRNIDQQGLVEGPVFHSFTVGTADTVTPFVVTTEPIPGAVGVGAGVPAPQPAGGPSEGVADVRTNIFGPTTPDVLVRFNEGIDSARVNANNFTLVNAGNTTGGVPPVIPPAAGFPALKSVDDESTLPSNGHEILWRADQLGGGFPFGTIIEGNVVGAYNDEASAIADPGGLNPDNPTPISDLSGNPMRITYKFGFQTLAPPDLPQNPFPEYGVWWAATDRVGAIDIVNQLDFARQAIGAATFPTGVPKNVLPQYTDVVTNSKNIAGFEPTEISVDLRTNFQTCHSWIYILSPNSGQIVVMNTYQSIPVAIINTPLPGGITNQTGGGQSANVLCVTNQSGNTFTVFDLNSVTPGSGFVNGPIFIQAVRPTGNNPKAIAISLSPTGGWQRDPGYAGPAIPFILYADFTDGVVSTTTLSSEVPIRQFSLGANAAPNDLAMTPCYVPCFGCPVIMYAAISQGGLPGQGKVAYYVAGPGCSSGSTTPIRPDAIVGSIEGFDAPAGLDDIFPLDNAFLWFAAAESGSQGNSVRILGTQIGSANLPQPPVEVIEGGLLLGSGSNPVAITHPASYRDPPCIEAFGLAPPFCTCCTPFVPCSFTGVEQQAAVIDGSLAPAQELYVALRGAGVVTVLNVLTGSRNFYSPVGIPGVRFVATHATQ